jgi:hypothetical protein
VITEGSTEPHAFPLRIGFLGDTESPNSRTWIEGLRSQQDVELSEDPRFETFGRTMRFHRLGADLGRLRRWLNSERLDVLIAYRTTSYGFAAALTGFHPLVLAAQGESDVWPAGGLGPARRYLHQRLSGESARLHDGIARDLGSEPAGGRIFPGLREGRRAIKLMQCVVENRLLSAVAGGR